MMTVRELITLAASWAVRVRGEILSLSGRCDIQSLKSSWDHACKEVSTEESFADDLAQRAVCGMVFAHLSGSEEKDALIEEARSIEDLGLNDLQRTLKELVIENKVDSRGEPWVYFYEDFLGAYDPAKRKKAGVWYTPTAVVQTTVKMVNHVLTQELERPLGFADPEITTLDPATGTGTFLVAAIDSTTAPDEHLSKNMIGFEILPGPHGLAKLRVGEALRRMTGRTDLEALVLRTNALDNPAVEGGLFHLFSNKEEDLADEIRSERKINVVIGNPPYRRVKGEFDIGGWVLRGPVPGKGIGSNLFDDLRELANQRGMGVHLKNAYNLYVFFWRWALWKVFEAHGDGPGVVAFVTASSWLTGPGFGGLRQIVREQADNVWIVDLGGNMRGAHPEKNVFGIGSPVSIVIVSRKNITDKSTLAKVHYHKVFGSVEDKLEELGRLPPMDSWEILDIIDPQGRMMPATEDSVWADMIPLTELFPWHQSGAKAGRTWVISPNKEDIRKRWFTLFDAPPEKRAELFQESRDRVVHKTCETKGVPSGPAVLMVRGDPGEPNIVKYGFRSFDTQWLLLDARFMNRASPSLWEAASDRQVYLSTVITTEIGVGPGMTCSAHVPDGHYFMGLEGGGMIPLYKEDGSPNCDAKLFSYLREMWGDVTMDDIGAYVYGLLSSPMYQEKFAVALRTPGPRVPLTADLILWKKVVAIGKDLMWLHTFGERFGENRTFEPLPDVHWIRPVTIWPSTIKDVTYNPVDQTLTVGDGVLMGVEEAVWKFEVSRMQIIRKWISYRTKIGAGRAVSSLSPLDKIRGSLWDGLWSEELVNLVSVLTITVKNQHIQAMLLERVINGPLISTLDLN